MTRSLFWTALYLAVPLLMLVFAVVAAVAGEWTAAGVLALFGVLGIGAKVLL